MAGSSHIAIPIYLFIKTMNLVLKNLSSGNFKNKKESLISHESPNFGKHLSMMHI